MSNLIPMNRIIYIFIFIGIILAFLPLAFYFLKFNGGLSEDQSDWSAFGTIFSSSLSFIAIIINTFLIYFIYYRQSVQNHVLTRYKEYKHSKKALNTLKDILRNWYELFSEQERDKEKLVKCAKKFNKDLFDFFNYVWDNGLKIEVLEKKSGYQILHLKLPESEDDYKIIKNINEIYLKRDSFLNRKIVEIIKLFSY